MACPGGRVLGGGRPYKKTEPKNRRTKGLHDTDRALAVRRRERRNVLPSLFRAWMFGKKSDRVYL